MSDWYQISNKMIQQHGGTPMLNYHSESSQAAIMFAFDDHDWLPWKFANRRRDLFDDLKVARSFLEWVGSQLNIADLSGWYRVSPRDVSRIGGKHGIWGRKKKYQSLPDLLKAAFPEHQWREWEFDRLPPTWWDDLDHQRAYFDALASDLFGTSARNLSQWYAVARKDLSAKRFPILLSNRYQGSLFAVLKNLYPNHEWHEWKFSQVAAGYWALQQNQRDFLQWAGSQMGIDPRSSQSWLSVDADKLRELGGSSLLERFGTVERAARAAFPEILWNAPVAS